MTAQDPAKRDETIPRALANKHFLVAAGILALTATAFYGGIVGWLKWTLYKAPVPWPAGVQVSGHFRMTSLPARLESPDGGAAYVYPERDADEDGAPDGDIPIHEDTMELLTMGTSIDEQRRPNRESSWLLARIYAKEGDPMSIWRLEAYYYTGLMDQVPHVPERCLQAGGATLLGGATVTFDVPEAPEKWRKITCNRVVYEIKGQKEVQYYTFSLNGSPEPDWKKVRLELTVPWVKYCYFAKIQFAPARPVESIEQADAEAQQFIRCFLPELLKAFPTPEDVAALE